MEGEFLRKKFDIWLFLLFVCGLYLIGLHIFINIVDTDATSEMLTLLIMGILICLVVIPLWLLNIGAFIHIDEDSIKAKYHWFDKIDCNISDVSFAVAKVNTLTIQLKDGKTHTIMGIANSEPLASVIRRNMPFEEIEQSEILIEKLNNLKSTRKKDLVYVCYGILLMFINIFVTVFITGEKELYEFSRNNWITFTIMCVIEIITVISTFYFARKAGKKTVPIEKLQYTIRRRIIEAKAILPGNVVKVFADDSYWGRITVFGYPNDNSVYYTVQEFASDYTFIKTYESEIIEDIEQLHDGFESLIDITKKFLH